MKLPTKPGDPDYLLRRALQANAAFSTLCGLVWIVGGEPLGRWFGRDGSMALDGVGLLVFAGLIAILSTRSPIPTLLAGLVVAADVLWAAGATVQLLGGAFSGPGSWVMGAIVVAVLDFAAFQALGLHHGRKARRAAAC